MKKIGLIILVLCMSTVLLTACGGDDFSYDVESTVNSIQETSKIDPVMVIDDVTLLSDLMNITTENVEEFYAIQSGAGAESDTIVMIKSTKGTSDDVMAELETFQTNLAETFAPYDSIQETKCENGLVIQKGDYVLLVIAGDNSRIENGEVTDVYSELQTAIDGILNK